MANKIKYNSGIDANALNIGSWSVGSGLGMGPSASTGFKNGIDIPEGGYAVYSDNISTRIALNDNDLISIINKLSSAPVQWYTLYAITYPESSYAPANRDGITPGFDNITGSKLYDASRDLNYYVFDEDTNTWLDNSWFNGERIDGHCYDTYDGAPNQHATFQADYDNIKANFPNATHIVIGSHAAERNTATTGTADRLKEIGLPQRHIDEGGRPEYILVGKVNEPAHQIYVKENVNWAVAHLNLALPLTGRRATTIQEALDWARDNNVLVLNRHIDNTVKDGLKLYLDAGAVTSYPKGGNKFYDLSGSNNHHNVVNNPVNNGRDFTLNETQGFNISNAATKSTNSTVVMWYKTTDSQELWVRGDSGSEYLAASYSNGNYYHDSVGSPTYYSDLNNVVNPNTQGVRDGRYHMVEAKNVNFSAWDSMNWFLYGSSWNMNGSVAKIMVYDRPLTTAESSQNYYGGPIITRNLQQHYDFSNLVCYETGQNEIRNLVNLSQSSAITNTASAISYNNQMGYLEWTGDSNAYIDIPDTGNMATFSLSTWVWNDPTGANSRHSILRNFWEIVDTSIQFWSYSFDNDYWRSSGNGAVPYNEWTHITTTWDGSVIRHYINGVLYWTDSNTSGGTSENMYHFGGYGGRMLDGKYATLSIYNDTLTDQEILDNYNAHAARFK
jgi:hypothetical protein